MARFSVNAAVLETTEFRSDRLSVLASVVHPIKQEGVYLGAVRQEKVGIASTFRVEVRDGSAEPQATIDLFTVFNRKSQDPEPVFETTRHNIPSLGGKVAFVIFFASEGLQTFYVTLDDAKKFDSRRLRPDDQFAVVLFQPGEYSMAELQHGLKGTISVDLPPEGYTGEKIEIEVDEKSLTPDKAQGYSTDTVVLAFATDGVGRIRLESPKVGERASDVQRLVPESTTPRRASRPSRAAKPGKRKHDVRGRRSK
jgi:hypothetical protein